MNSKLNTYVISMILAAMVVTALWSDVQFLQGLAVVYIWFVIGITVGAGAYIVYASNMMLPGTLEGDARVAFKANMDKAMSTLSLRSLKGILRFIGILLIGASLYYNGFELTAYTYIFILTIMSYIVMPVNIKIMTEKGMSKNAN